VFNRRQSASLKLWVIPLGLFALALAARVPGLDTFNTVDEHIWVYRSQSFVGGLLFADYACPPVEGGRQFPTTGLGCTLQSGHPGVTTMWGGGLGLLAYYWQTVRPTGLDLHAFLNSSDLLHPDLIAAMRLPLAVVSSLFVLSFYFLVRRVLDEKVAFVTTLLVALSPFQIALSRVLHQDALTANFMILSLLCMIGYWLQGWKRRWLLVSAILAGVAFLAKAVSWYMMPCAAMVGLFSLYFRWRRGHWRGWASVGQMAGEGILWGAVAWLTFAALFPAMWVIPGEVIRRLVDMSLGKAQTGHEADQFFLGIISRNPGPLLYPLGWLLEASPWEILGLLALPVAAWHTLRCSLRLPLVTSLRQKLDGHPVPVALACFVATFLLFETLSNKKAVRYFLPAFPVIDIFVAMGLLWLAGRLAQLSRKETIRRWALPTLCGLLVLGQGWLVAGNYPYYFTYYNPLFGGAPGAARMIDVGWGEGLNEAGAYLNRQPDSQSLLVTADYYTALSPFFAGEVNDFNRSINEVMKSDYLVFYRRHLQSELHDPNLWRYFDQHYKPVESITLQGLDYALIYRNPIAQHVCAQDNNLPDALNPFGYSLAADGNLTLFWQNLAGGDQVQAVQAGLTSVADGETRWVTCAPAPAFAAEAGLPGAFLESQCPLGASGTPPGYYDLRLGWGDGGRATPLLIDDEGRFGPVAPATVLASLAEQGLVVPLDIAFGDRVSLVGYRLEPTAWRAGGEGTLVLYWKIRGVLNSSLADQFELSLRLFAPGAAEPILTTPHPILPRCLEARDLAPGTVVPVRYSRLLPTSLSPGTYTLKACLTAPGGGQVVTGQQSDASQPLDCLPLPVNVVR
jgi:hypothetical protein